MKKYDFKNVKLTDIHFEADRMIGESCTITFRLSGLQKDILNQIQKIGKENQSDFICNVNHDYEKGRMKVELHRIDGT